MRSRSTTGQRRRRAPSTSGSATRAPSSLRLYRGIRRLPGAAAHHHHGQGRPGHGCRHRRAGPFLEDGDIVVDAGNAHFVDTQRREQALRERGLHFVGTGVSGGEEGALLGPSIMPGGSPESYEALGPLLEDISAKVDGTPCCVYVGRGGAGHFVKMVHNGIEYADMQLIAEATTCCAPGWTCRWPISPRSSRNGTAATSNRS